MQNTAEGVQTKSGQKNINGILATIIKNIKPSFMLDTKNGS